MAFVVGPIAKQYNEETQKHTDYYPVVYESVIRGDATQNISENPLMLTREDAQHYADVLNAVEPPKPVPVKTAKVAPK